jgi:A/G-specific adenine glycosylase
LSRAPAPIAPALLDWYASHGRSDLPWKHPRDAYRIWVSEIMLQQTQVTTVLPYFERFIARFPDVRALAAADQDQVLALWTGLGYYARARNLHKAAQHIVSEFGGRFPERVDELASLPGIGRSTAGAIAAMAFDVHAPILDGNVKRVLARLFAIDTFTGERQTEKRLWGLAEALTPAERVADYTQAIMDLGAKLCVRARPQCERCPLADRCEAKAAGLERQLPVPRPKREKPERSTRMLIVEAPDGRVLLERRPPSGIWGGLWCFPQLEEEDAGAAAHAAERLALDPEGVEHVEDWAELTHVFTHFSLRIRPVRLRAHVLPDNVRDDDQDWFDPADTAALGLAAPVKRLLGVLAGGDLLG